MARRTVAKRLDQNNQEFVASHYSNQELQFLMDHLGESPEVAMPEDVELPRGVNPAAVSRILDVTFRLDTIEKAMREKGDETPIWCGVEKLKDICEKSIEWNETVRQLKLRTENSDGPIRRAAGAPSLHMWDPDTDIPYLGGIGADSEIVRTAIDDNGKRVPLYVMLRETGVGAIRELSGVAAFLKAGKQARTVVENTPNALIYNTGATTSNVECPICGYAEVYETGKPATKRKAETAMRKHIKGSRVKRDEHHLLGQRLDSGKAGTGSAVQDDENEA